MVCFLLVCSFVGLFCCSVVVVVAVAGAAAAAAAVAVVAADCARRAHAKQLSNALVFGTYMGDKKINMLYFALV